MFCDMACLFSISNIFKHQLSVLAITEDELVWAFAQPNKAPPCTLNSLVGVPKVLCLFSCGMVLILRNETSIVQC